MYNFLDVSSLENRRLEGQKWIVVRNIKPINWEGHSINCVLYKCGSVFAMENEVGPDSTCRLPVTNKLGFGIVLGHKEPGSTFETLHQLLYHWNVDTTPFKGCTLVVTLEHNPGTGEFLFTFTHGEKKGL